MSEDRDLRYPLHWPHGRPRTPAHKREKAPFFTQRVNSHGWREKQNLSFSEARSRLIAELERVDARNAVLSTNLELRLDGLPRSGTTPEDPGVAVYFTRRVGGKDLRYALCCDRWNTVAGNMAAIAKHIEAMRGMERWGVGTLDQAFTGYLRLEDQRDRAPTDPAQWRQIFRVEDLNATPAEMLQLVEAAYASQIKLAHPDHGGSHERMALLNAARDQARKELRP